MIMQSMLLLEDLHIAKTFIHTPESDNPLSFEYLKRESEFGYPEAFLE